MELIIDIALCIYYGLKIYINEYGFIFAAFTLIITSILFLAKIFHGRGFGK